MSRLLRHVALVVLLSAVAGCSTVKDAKDSVTGWFNGGDSTISTTTGKKAAGDSSGPLLKYGATLRVNKYVDQRKLNNPRLLGITTQRVRGVVQFRARFEKRDRPPYNFFMDGFRLLSGVNGNKPSRSFFGIKVQCLFKRFLVDLMSFLVA